LDKSPTYCAEAQQRINEEIKKVEKDNSKKRTA